MPRMRTQIVGNGDQSWLGSTHGLSNARTETLDTTGFASYAQFGDNTSTGFIPSGTPLAKVGGVMVPYNAAGTDGSQVLAGFLLTDQSLLWLFETKIPVAVLDHGRVKTAKIASIVGTFVAPSAADDATEIVFI